MYWVSLGTILRGFQPILKPIKSLTTTIKPIIMTQDVKTLHLYKIENNNLKRPPEFNLNGGLFSLFYI